jgi:hypothetical protein
MIFKLLPFLGEDMIFHFDHGFAADLMDRTLVAYLSK